MTIQTTSIKDKNFKSNTAIPSLTLEMGLVSYNATTRIARYSNTRNWSYTENGEITFDSTSVASDSVSDEAGNRLPANSASATGNTLTIAIPVPSDTSPPTIVSMTVTPATITTAGSHTVTLDVEFNDA